MQRIKLKVRIFNEELIGDNSTKLFVLDFETLITQEPWLKSHARTFNIKHTTKYRNKICSEFQKLKLKNITIATIIRMC